MAAIARASAARPGGDPVRRRFHLAGGGDELGDERLAMGTRAAATCTIRQGEIAPGGSIGTKRKQWRSEQWRPGASTGGTVVQQAASQQGTWR